MQAKEHLAYQISPAVWKAVTGQRVDHDVVVRVLPGESSVCAWSYDSTHEKWDTDCDEGFVFDHDGPPENQFNFCPNCGRQICMMDATADTHSKGRE